MGGGAMYIGLYRGYRGDAKFVCFILHWWFT